MCVLKKCNIVFVDKEIRYLIIFYKLILVIIYFKIVMYVLFLLYFN